MSSWVSGRMSMRRMSPLEPHHRRLADLEVQVGAFMLHHHAEQLVDFRLAAAACRRHRLAGRRCRVVIVIGRLVIDKSGSSGS